MPRKDNSKTARFGLEILAFILLVVLVGVAYAVGALGSSRATVLGSLVTTVGAVAALYFSYRNIKISNDRLSLDQQAAADAKARAQVDHEQVREAARQSDLRSEQSHNLNERRRMDGLFATATQQLASEQVSNRIGGIIILERIVSDPAANHVGQEVNHNGRGALSYESDIVTMLADFVRQRTHDDDAWGLGEEDGRRLRGDIQQAVSALCRITRPVPSREAVRHRRGPHAANRANPSSFPYRLATLEGAKLRYVDLTRVDLSQANLRRIDLREAILKHATLTEAYLNEADLQKADLAVAFLDGADLRQAKLAGANLGGANLERADLTEAQLERARLSAASLSEAKLEDANLQNARLDTAILRSVRLDRADLSSAYLVGAILNDACLEGANLTGANLGKARLGYASLADATLVGANLANASLVNANLTNANLTGADLTHADFTGAVVDGIVLTNAILDNVEGLPDDVQARATSTAVVLQPAPPSRLRDRIRNKLH